MSERLDVLVVESHPGVADDAAAGLAASGHRVHRCHYAGFDAFPCVGVADPGAWLVRATTRLCIDRLRAAKAERAAYRGPWLPEPLIEPLAQDPLERAEDVSVAFLLALERLSPLERAVFLLHDVFDEDYAAVAETLERTEPAVRQLASRARRRVQGSSGVPDADHARKRRIVAAFLAASRNGDFAALLALIDPDGVLRAERAGSEREPAHRGANCLLVPSDH